MVSGTLRGVQTTLQVRQRTVLHWSPVSRLIKSCSGFLLGVRDDRYSVAKLPTALRKSAWLTVVTGLTGVFASQEPYNPNPSDEL